MTAQDPDFGHRLLSSLRSGLVAIDGQGYVIELNPDALRILFGRGSSAADAELKGRGSPREEVFRVGRYVLRPV